MNTVELNKILTRNPVTRKAYLGCFAADQIPQNTTIPYCMVINTDPISKRGTHWVCVFCENPHSVDFYDSTGVWPPASYGIKEFLSKYARVRYNRMPLQQLYSRSCGKHVIFFLYHRCRNVPFEKIVRFLRDANADSVVNSFVKKIIFDINN